MAAKRSSARPATAPQLSIIKAAPAPVFVHSSFRSASTWLWEKFRADQSFLAFYEIFNEALADLNFKSVRASAMGWNSHHPRTAPYFLEFVALLETNGGVSGYDRSMAFQSFFPAGGANGDISAGERAYVERLILVGHLSSKTPVLTCTRSLARVAGLRRAFGGVHLVLVRNLWHQWLSYSNQLLNGNPYFIDSIIHSVFGSSNDAAVEVLRHFMRDNNIGLSEGVKLDDDLFIAFIVLHVYLISIASPNADLVIRVNELARSSIYRERIEDELRNLCNASLDLRDAIEAISVPESLLEDRLRAKHTVEMLWNVICSAGHIDSKAEQIAKFLFEELWAEIDQHTRYVAPLFNRMRSAEVGAAEATLQLQSLRVDYQALVSQQADWSTSSIGLNQRIAALEGHAAVLAAERDGLASDVAHLTANREMLAAALGERDHTQQFLTARLDEAAAQLREAAEQRVQLEATAADLGSRLQITEADRADLTLRLEASAGQVEQLTARLDEAAAQLREAAEQRVQLEATAADLGSRLQITEAVALKQEDDLQLAGANLTQATDEISHLKQALTDAEANLGAKIVECGRLELEQHTIRQELIRHREIAETAQKQLSLWQRQSVWKKIMSGN